MRLYMPITSLIAVSKCVVASNESERKTCIPRGARSWAQASGGL